MSDFAYLTFARMVLGAELISYLPYFSFVFREDITCSGKQAVSNRSRSLMRVDHNYKPVTSGKPGAHQVVNMTRASGPAISNSNVSGVRENYGACIPNGGCCTAPCPSNKLGKSTSHLNLVDIIVVLRFF